MKNGTHRLEKLWGDCLPRLMKLQFWTLLGILAAQVFGKPEAASGLFTVTFFLTLLIWLCQGMQKLDTGHRIALAIVMVSGISVAGNGLLTQTRISFAYFQKWLMFCTSVLFLAVSGCYRPERREVDRILRGSTLLSALLVGMYGFYPEKMYLLNGRVSRYLTFRLTNPNLTAVFLAGFAMLQWVQAGKTRGIRRLCSAGLGGILTWFVVLTQSRNGQLVMAFFLLVLFLAGLGYGIALNGWVRWLAAAFPLVFAAGYLLLIRLPPAQRLFGFLAGEGKNLDSRVWIWELALEQTAKHPLFGAYSQISDGTGLSQMHNSHLDVLASYGVVTFCLVCLFLYRLLKPVGKGRGAYLCRMAFFSLLLAGMGEAMLFSGGMGVYLLFGFLRILANYDFEET